MRYSPPNNRLYTKNRANFAKRLKKNSIAVFHSNDIMPTNADGMMPFHQNNDLFYLTGIDQEETILMVYPDFHDHKLKEILFIRETNEEIAIWEGHKYTKEEAREISGIETVLWASDFDRIFNTLMAEAENVYLNTNEHIRAEIIVETRNARFIKSCRERYPLHQYHRSSFIMHQLRAVKSDEEIFALQEACDITEKGFRRILNFVKPGVMEYEIEAEYIHEFLRNKSKGFAYSPIIASGFNSCVLHYVENSKACNNGDILLMDVAAEYGNYNADMTRSIPVNGQYTKRQKEVYNAVLRVKREAMKMLIPGNTIPAYHKEVGKFMESELLGLGLIDKTDIKNQSPESPAYKRYFMHGTSHHLGLDVHDVGNIYQEMKTGMVFTVEPGIYIREENLGIRLENDVVITSNGVTDLMKNIPIEADEIEELMNK
ncbi:MAG: aminopeptidase P family protein [Cyclobacteriaceae bacterium]|nr:aminopeptidase P family protein [Cyclobacteriaceae bacterium]